MTVAVFAQGEKAKEAEDAGADHVGGEDLAAKVQEGFTDFDVAIATPDMMGTVGRLGRILGPQGKMPSPKAGTITFDIEGVSDIRPTRSSTAPTAPRSSTRPSARSRSRSARWSRTTAPFSTRSSGPSRRPRRAATGDSITISSTVAG